MSISLNASVRTCKVDTGWANKIESDRFLNPNNMVCPVWNGQDLAGRSVCPDSFYTKRAGCNSAVDRVVVENNVSRPQYAEFISLDANGIAGDIYAGSLINQNASCRTNVLDDTLDITGQFGYETRASAWNGASRVPCGNLAEAESTMEQMPPGKMAVMARQSQMAKQAFGADKQAGGMQGLDTRCGN